MQMSSSQIGISWAMLRFSTLQVPVGNVPSTGRALTGSKSPSPAIIFAVTRRMKSIVDFGHRRQPAGGAGHGGRHVDLVQIVKRTVDRREIALQNRLAPLAVRLADGLLDFVNRFVSRQHVGQARRSRSA